MCTGLEIAAIAAAVGGTGATAAGQSAQKKSNARSQNQQTELSASEFNTRDQLAKQVFAENTGISRQTYDELAALDDQAFAERTGLSKQAFNQLSEIERQQVVRDAAAAVGNVDAIRNIRTGREGEQAAARTDQYTEEDAARAAMYGEQDTARSDQYSAQDAARREQYAGRDAARAQYEADLAAGNAVQTGFRGQAQGEADALLRAFTPEAMDGRRVSAASARDAAVQSAITPRASATPAGNIDPVLAAAFQRYSDAGRSAAVSNAGARSKVMAYSDAAGEGDRSIARTDQNVAMIADQARRALDPLNAQLGVSSLKYNNAGALGDAKYSAAGEYGKARYGASGEIGAARYGNATARGDARVNNAALTARGRNAAADADLEAALGLSSTRAGGESRAVTSYTGAQDDALSKFFSGRSDSSAARGNTLINANDAKLQGSAAVSQNLENGMNNITAFRAANTTSPWTTLGQFASAVTPTLFNQAAQNGTGFGFRKPAPPTATVS